MQKRSGTALVETLVIGLIGVLVTGAVYSMAYVSESEVLATDDNYQLERARESVVARLSSGSSLPDDFYTNGCKVERMAAEKTHTMFRVTRHGFKEERTAYVIWPAEQ